MNDIAKDSKVKAAQQQSEYPWEELERLGRQEHAAKAAQAARTPDPAVRRKLEAEADLAEARANHAEGKLRLLR